MILAVTLDFIARDHKYHYMEVSCSHYCKIMEHITPECFMAPGWLGRLRITTDLLLYRSFIVNIVVSPRLSHSFEHYNLNIAVCR